MPHPVVDFFFPLDLSAGKAGEDVMRTNTWISVVDMGTVNGVNRTANEGILRGTDPLRLHLSGAGAARLPRPLAGWRLAKCRALFMPEPKCSRGPRYQPSCRAIPAQTC